MMRYRIRHTTTYAYNEAVPVCHNRLLMTPRNDGNATCHRHRIRIEPKPDLTTWSHDYFGNSVYSFSIERNHHKLSITATSEVEARRPVERAADESPAWEEVASAVAGRSAPGWFEASQFVFDSPQVTRSADLRDYALGSFKPRLPILAALDDLLRRIHHDFVYDKRATHVGTLVDEALRLRRGVCQDFAHVMAGCLRSLGLAARYVSGYLRTVPPPGKPRLIGADQSHAWCSAWCGELGWIDLDPTNNRFCGTDHITTAWGRDYTDAAPVRGVLIGGGLHGMTVTVDVQPLEEPAGAAED